MSRSSFSIKQLIPRIHNHNHADDDDDISLFWDNDEKASLKVTGGLGSPSPKLTGQWQKNGTKEDIRANTTDANLNVDSTGMEEDEHPNDSHSNNVARSRELDSGEKDITTESKLSFGQTGALAIPTPPRTTVKLLPPLKPNNSTSAPVPPPRSPRRPPPRIASIARNASVSKVRRTHSQRSQKSVRRKVRPTSQKPAFKWTASARDLLNVRLFPRLEVAEVLSPGKLHEIRMSRCSSLVPRISTESDRTECSETTPVDPFSLQDLPTRIGAAGVAVALEGEENTLSSSKRTSKPATMVAGKDIPFPSLPAKNPARFSPHGVPLPSIPEVMITSPNNKTSAAVLSPTSVVHPEHEAYLTLPSTNYTMAAPFFRHGPIRLAKSDIVRSHTSSQLSFAAEVDRTLDWTAFQISILGGAGDLYSESRDYLKREEEEERLVDELCDWWEGYGFESYGRIQRDAHDQYSSGTTHDAIGAPTEIPQITKTDLLSGLYNRLPQSTEGGLLTSRFSTARNLGSRRWTVEGRSKHPATGKHLGMNFDVARQRRPSMESLPQSPMLDLEVMKDVKGEEYVVPMGYNLDHDLGDFLAWEAQNVWVDGFGLEEAELPA
ncbi:hypothetical protein DL546_009058 [Coniochaeta pulveracea]|uniref:Uncharacterized protein n=1 Tax=Coniochaeta pulveracea TaxID=177199 RepID=A0A420YKI6_9PEZI|nr:hypothetical protein DL546_009058 [Coniochaeta pulveracea]